MTASGNADHSRDPFAGGKDQGETLQLVDYWRSLQRRRGVVLTSLAIVVVATTVLTLLATPTYEASTTLEIERQSPEILEFTDVIGSDPAGYKDFYQTQYRILQSRAVSRLTVERLDLLHRPEFARREDTPARRLMRWVRASTSGAPDSGADPLKPAIEFVEKNMRIRPIRKSHLVAISFSDRDPQLAADVANAVAEAYQEFQRDSRYRTTGVAKEFLARDVLFVRGEIDVLERQLQVYAVENRLLGLRDGSADISEQALTEINGRYTSARMRLAEAEARLGSVRNSAPDGLPEVLESLTIAQLRQQHSELERDLSQMQARFNDGWPPLVELAEETRKAKEQLDSAMLTIADQVRAVARSRYEQIAAEAANLERERALQMKEVQRVNLETVEYDTLSAEIQTKRSMLGELAERQSESETSYRLKDTTSSNIRVVDIAEVPTRPSYPRKGLNLLLALLVGTSLGVGMAFVVDHLDNSAKTEADVERSTGLPVLGHIPLTSSLRLVDAAPGTSRADLTRKLDLASHLDPHSGFAETFRNLRTSLLLAVPDHPPRNVAVTSCEPSVGKSTVALNLAIVLTQLGRRVLLIDADLRRPRLQTALQLGNSEGLSNFLSGNATLESLVRETEVPNLRVITSGPIPPNPSELLGSPLLNALMTHFATVDAFDHILFDSAPLLSVTDAVLLATKMDSTLLVVRAGQTTREALGHSASRLRQSRAHVMGAVLNAVPEREGYYGRYRYEASPSNDTGRKKNARPPRRRAG